jgi:integrase
MKVMKRVSNYSFSWNAKESVWIARYRAKDGSWKVKWLPKRIVRADPIGAETWLIDFYQKYLISEERVTNAKVVPVKVSLEVIAPKWLQLKYNDKDTKPNTYAGMCNSVKNKIVNSSIAKLDMETELTVPVIREWINNLTGAYNSRLSYISHLTTLINDCIGEGYLNEELVNVFDKPAIRKVIKGLRKAKKIEKKEIGNIVMERELVHALLTADNKKIRDYRRIKYVLVLSTGLRDAELQGLIWQDICLSDDIPVVNVYRQLDEAGIQPFIKYEDLVKQKFNKDQIKEHANARMSNPKYDSKRIIPLHDLTIAAIKWWKETGWRLYVGRMPKESDPVFPRGKESLKDGEDPDGFCFSESSELLRSDLLRAEMMVPPEITFHSTRRTFATMLSNAGVEESKVGVLLGHASKTVTAAHYIGKHLPLFRSFVSLLDFPTCLQLERVQISLEKPAE